jgi:FAD binding domain
MMLGLLLVRSGIDVVVLEKHGDFLRDFRGDTIHPSTLEVLHELGFLEEHRINTDDLQTVQRRPEFPTRLTQRLQVIVQDRVIGRVLGSREKLSEAVKESIPDNEFRIANCKLMLSIIYQLFTNLQFEIRDLQSDFFTSSHSPGRWSSSVDFPICVDSPHTSSASDFDRSTCR